MTVVANKGYQRIEAPKDYEHRSIPVPGFLLEPLRAQTLDGRPRDPVFYGARSRTWLRNHTFRNGWFDPAAHATGLPGLTPHDLRPLDRYADLFEDDLDAVAVALDHAALRKDVGKALYQPWRAADRNRKTPGSTRGSSCVIPAGFEPALPP